MHSYLRAIGFSKYTTKQSIIELLTSVEEPDGQSELTGYGDDKIVELRKLFGKNIGITWNGTREIIYLVNNPEKAATKLQALIDKKKYPREFDFSIEPDYNWDKIKWCFDAIKD